MEILQTIWTAISTPNPELIQILGIPFVLLEVTVTMLLFTTILDINSTKKQRIGYILSVFVLSLISNNLIPREYGSFIHTFITLVLIMVFFKTKLLRAIVAEILPLAIVVLLETIFVKLFSSTFNLSFDMISNIPIYRESIILLIYLAIYLLYRVLKHFNIKLKINAPEFFSKKSKITLIVSTILALASMGLQVYLIIFYIDNLPVGITAFNIVTLLAYFILTFYSLIKTNDLASVNQDLEKTKLYNSTLQILHDNIRSFKHDFSNIVQSIGGYVNTNDIDGLKKYYSQLLEDCTRVNNLSTLSPDVINNPAVYSLLTAKYHEADSRGIKINLQIFLNLNDLNMRIYEFTRILGILLDNAIDAASACDEKIINLEMRKQIKPDRQVLIIENTYSNKDVDTTRIFEKGYTSKKDATTPHGLGLWEVKQILKKNKNLDLFTSKNDNYFTQKFTIY